MTDCVLAGRGGGEGEGEGSVVRLSGCCCGSLHFVLMYCDKGEKMSPS